MRLPIEEKGLSRRAQKLLNIENDQFQGVVREERSQAGLPDSRKSGHSLIIGQWIKSAWHPGAHGNLDQMVRCG